VGSDKPGGTSESVEVNIGKEQGVSGNVDGEPRKRPKNGQQLNLNLF